MTSIPADQSIETATALAKLARALQIEADEVWFLADLPVAELRALHWQVIDRLHDADRKRLSGVVSSTAIVPAGLAATIGEKWFGPVLCARLVGLFEPKQASGFAKHLSVDFMADITARTDPRVVGGLVEHLPVKTMQDIACTLVERGDYLTLSHFVGHIPAPVVAAILDAIDDNAAVVRVARFVDDLDHLDPVVALLDDDRIVALVTAVDDTDLWVDGLHLFSHLGDEQVTRIATTIVRSDQERVASALDAFERHGLWDQGLALLRSLDASDLATFADMLLIVDDRLVHAAIDAIDHLEVWDVLVDIGAAAGTLAPELRRRVGELLEGLAADRVDRFRTVAAERGHDGLLERLLAPA